MTKAASDFVPLPPHDGETGLASNRSGAEAALVADGGAPWLN